jgi:diacylglycerol O-acyltransferase / wax synthase
MSSRDASFLYLERSHALLHIGCVAILDEPLSPARIARRIEGRLAQMPRYAQRPVDVPLGLAHPSWEDDPGFAARRHVQRWSLPAPGGETELAEIVAALLEQPLDRSRPLWEVHVIEGLDGDRCAVFQKVHHCMVDGLAGAQLLETLLDADAEARDPLPLPTVPAPLPPARRRVGRALGEGLRDGARRTARWLSVLRHPSAAREELERLRAGAWSALRLATDEVPVLPWNRPIGPRRRLDFTRLPLAGIRRIRERRGGTLNDVVLSVLAGGLHRYLDANGIATRGLEPLALVPVALRSADEARALGNRISAMLVPLAVDASGEVARLAATRAITERLKEGRAWVGIDALLSLMDGAPSALVAGVARQIRFGRVANLVATNVPGPRAARWLCGRRVAELRPIVPVADGLGLGLAVFSYDGWLQVGLNADADLVPDLEKLRQGVEEAYAALLTSS